MSGGLTGPWRRSVTALAGTSGARPRGSRWVVTAVVVAASIAALLTTARAGRAQPAVTDSAIVFPMGKERRLVAAVAPHGLQTPIVGGWSLSGLQVGKSSLRYELRRDATPAALVVRLTGTLGADGRPDFTISYDPPEPPSETARASLDRLRDAFVHHAEEASFWASVVEVSRDGATAPGRSIGSRGTQRWLWRVTAALALLAAAWGGRRAWRRQRSGAA